MNDEIKGVAVMKKIIIFAMIVVIAMGILLHQPAQAATPSGLVLYSHPIITWGDKYIKIYYDKNTEVFTITDARNRSRFKIYPYNDYESHYPRVISISEDSYRKELDVIPNDADYSEREHYAILLERLDVLITRLENSQPSVRSSKEQG